LQEHRQFVCVTCPVGCALEATLEGGLLTEVHGQACRRGPAFVQEEITAPKRMFTSTVRVRGGAMPLAPVRSREPVPKGLLLALAAELRKVVLQAPISEHQVVLPDALHSGVDIVASRAVEALA